MGQSNTVNVTVTGGETPEIPEDIMRIKVIMPNGTPAYNCDVTLANKTGVPMAHTKNTGSNGYVDFTGTDLVPLDLSYLFFAYIDNSPHGYYIDNFTTTNKFGNITEIRLKEYTKPPELFLKIEMNQVVGSELFGEILSKITQASLQFSGLEVTKVTGEGTRIITIYFTPPWSTGSVHIVWSAVWFILSVLTLIGLLLVLKWTFGEAAPAIAIGGIGAVLILGLLLLTKRSDKNAI